MNWVVLGISGVSCGGKTTFTQALHEAFPEVVIFHQDTYYLEPSDPRHVMMKSVNHLNWDIPSSLDMGKMRKDIRDILAR